MAAFSEIDSDFLRDNDSLYVLPLKFVPFETAALRRCRLIKTYPLDTAVEVYAHGEQGRGYFLLDDLLDGGANATFGWDDDEHHPDQGMLRVLGNLKSYDVFNLRLKFRQYNIDYEGNEYLCLSSEMEQELTVYMRQFTRPLIQTIFGEHGKESDAQSVGDIVGLLRNPDSAEAMENLRRLAERLQTTLDDIPAFLHEFSDVYMAVSYYKHYADGISVMNAMLSQELRDAREAIAWKRDLELDRFCTDTKSRLDGLLMEVFRRLDLYETGTKNFWADLNAERFRDIQFLLRDSQDVIGGILCGLGVKLARWRERFPSAEHGGPASRLDAIQNELSPGIDDLARLATTGARSLESRDVREQSWKTG